MNVPNEWDELLLDAVGVLGAERGAHHAGRRRHQWALVRVVPTQRNPATSRAIVGPIGGGITRRLPQPTSLARGSVYLPGLIVATITAPVSTRVMSPESTADSMGSTDVSICPFTVLARGMVPIPSM